MEAQGSSPGGADERRRRRKPSTGYPVIDLGEVASVLARASQHGWEHTVAEFAGYMGHATVNSGAFRSKYAALRDYGVISGRGESVEITGIGRKIAIPEAEEEGGAALREAFTNTVFGAVYQESVKGSPISIESIGRRAVTRLGVAPSAQGSFGEVFARSAVTAGLAEAPGDGKITLLARPRAVSSRADPASSEPAPASDALIAERDSADRPKPKPVIDQRWPLPDGEVALIVAIDRPLSANDFGSVGEVVAKIEQLVAGLAGGDSSV